jgi:hypothetical protein
MYIVASLSQTRRTPPLLLADEGERFFPGEPQHLTTSPGIFLQMAELAGNFAKFLQ